MCLFFRFFFLTSIDWVGDLTVHQCARHVTRNNTREWCDVHPDVEEDGFIGRLGCHAIGTYHTIEFSIWILKMYVYIDTVDSIENYWNYKEEINLSRPFETSTHFLQRNEHSTSRFAFKYTDIFYIQYPFFYLPKSGRGNNRFKSSD